MRSDSSLNNNIQRIVLANESAISVSDANPALGHDKEKRKSTGHIMVTTLFGMQDVFLLLSFPCSADHERDWPPCKEVFSGWQPTR